MDNQPTTTTTDTSTFDLKLSDDDLLDLIKKPLQESEQYWDTKLKSIREDNMNLWLPNHLANKQIYDYQENYLYQSPKIFTSVETTCSIVNSRIAQPEVMPAEDTLISKQVAKDLQKALFAHAEKYRALDIFRIATRNLLLKRVGFIKLRFDPLVGDKGEIVPEHVAPEDIVVDQDAKWGEVPRFIAQKIRNKTIEELLAQFPDAQQKVLEMIGVTRIDKNGDRVLYKTMLGKKKNIWEVWFKFFEDGQIKGGVMWCDENTRIVLGKEKNPNWNYEEESDERCSNLLDYPAPPFIPLNYLNDGTSYIDLTTVVEQTAPLQRIVDRTGLQISENVEMAGSGLIFNTVMITKGDIALLTGAPDERIGVKGKVGDAVMRIAPPPLPNYVMEYKLAAEKDIDNAFATHDISRGEQSTNPTLGQDQMQRSQDYTRMDDISRAIERAATQYNRYLVQMIKVYYTEEHWFKATGEDGQFDHVVISSDLIEDGLDVSVEAGSTLPLDKQGQREAALELAKDGLIDPMSLFEDLGMSNAKKRMERLVKWKTDPMSFIADVAEEDFSREAFMDIQILIAGEMPKPRDEYNDIYFKFMNNYMISGDFEKQPDLIKQMFVEYMKIAQEAAQKQLQMMMSQAPTPEDMQGANQKAVEEAGVTQQLNAAQPQPMQPGADQAQALSQKTPTPVA